MAADEFAGDSDDVRVRVASREHLLILKLAAFANRAGSSHGDKDQRDIAKLLVLLQYTKPVLVLAYATDEDIKLLDFILQSSAFTQLAANNAQLASKLRKRAEVFVRALKAER